MDRPIEHTSGSPPAARPSIPRLAGTLLALGLLAYLLARQGWQEILASLRLIPVGELVGAGALIMLSRLAVAGRWQVLLRAAGVRLPHGQILRLTFAGLFASNFLPSTIGGDIVRLAGALRFRADRAVSAASIAVDRLVGMAGMATALPLGLPALLAWLAVGGSAASQAAASAPWLLRWGRKVRDRSRHVLLRLVRALALWLRQPGALLGALGFSWLHMLSKFTAIWLLLRAMENPLSLGLVAGLWSFTYFITLVPISINGLGVQEVSMAFLYANLGGVSLSAALTAALLVRTLEMAASLPGALFVSDILAPPASQRES